MWWSTEYEGKIYTLEGPWSRWPEVGKDYQAFFKGDLMVLLIPQGKQDPEEMRFCIKGVSERAEGGK